MAIKSVVQNRRKRDPLNFKELIDSNKIDIRQANRRSFTWYTDTVQELTGLGFAKDGDKLIRQGLKGRRAKTQDGFMYVFGYDAKHKATLEYWDKFPMVLPISTDSKGFTGFNIHYLPYRTRAIILQRILEFASNDRLDYTTRVKMTWKIAQSFSKIEVLSFCVKRYLWNHVKTPFKQIPPEDWGLVALLPIHEFVGASAARAWSDTLRKGLK